MKRPLRAALLLLCWALQTPAANAGDDPASIELETLMDRFAASAGVRARFRETKHLDLLAAPLETEGRLYFAPPDRLARTTTHPGPSRIVVVGDQVALWDETGHQRIALGGDEMARQLVDNLAVLLRGDLPGLRERYSVDFRSDASGWQLTLAPRAPEVRSLIEEIRFAGSDARLTRIETRESGGDRTVTLLSEVEVDHRFEPREEERIFSLEDGDGAR